MTPPDDRTFDHIPDPSGTVRPPEGMTPSVILGTGSYSSSAGGEWAPPGFAIEKELGRGGMGIVYLAHQAGLNRPVALKLIKADDADSVSVLRFLAEAEAMAAVRHPNVAQVYQYGQHAGRPFLALEYCGGGNLYDRIKDIGRFAPSDAATLIASIADGVQAAHAAGIVHRDLKPANVLFDNVGTPKVTDFGLAKRNAGDHLTQTDAVMGTPAYMSPEQARGQGKFVDPRMDVWALGVMLYELLAGRRPFEGVTPLDLLRKVLDSAPTDLRSLSASIPRDLGRICDKCLRKDAAERYATAGDLADDLRRFRAGEPIRAKRAAAAVQAWKWAKRNRLAAGSLAGVLATFAAGAAVSAWFAVEARKEAVRADGEKEEAKKAAKREQDRAAGEEQERKRADRERDVAKAASLRADEAAKREQARAEGEARERRRADQERDTAKAAALRADEATKREQARAEGEARERKRADEKTAAAEASELRSRQKQWVARWNELKAQQNELQARRLVGRMAVAEGLRQIENGDELRALAWLARPLQVAPEAAIDDLVGDRIAAYRIFGRHPALLILAGEPEAVGLTSRHGMREIRVENDKAKKVGTARVWDSILGVPITPPLPHARGINSASFSPDGRQVVTASGDGTARVWDAVTGIPLTPPLPHTESVQLALFSPDGQRVLTASGSDAQVWDAATGQPVTSPLPHGNRAIPTPFNRVRMASFSPDGQRLLTVSGSDARVWDAATGQPLTPPLPHTGLLHSASFSPDARLVATASWGAARVWDVATGKLVTPPLPHANGVNSVSFSPDGRRVATASDDMTARVWEVATGQPLTPPLSHKNQGIALPFNRVNSASFSPDGRRVLTVNGSDARVWDAATGQPLTPPLPHTYSVQSASFTLDGRRVTVMSGPEVREWDTAVGVPHTLPLRHTDWLQPTLFSLGGRRLASMSRYWPAQVWDAVAAQPPPDDPFEPKRPSPVLSASFNLDGRRVVTAYGPEARVWDTVTGRPNSPPLVHAGTVRVVSFSPDGLLVVTGSDDRTARVWDAATGRPITPPLVHGGEVRSVAFSPDGRRVGTASSDKTARVWDVTTGLPVTPSLIHTEWLFSAAFSPDGRRVATASSDKTARVWDAATGAPVTPPLAHAGQVLSASFSPDGRRVVTASNDRTARMWDAATGAPVTPTLLHTEGVQLASFSPDGRRVVTASGSEARVWDAATGQPITLPLPHTNGIASVSFSPDGRRVATASWDKTARVWDAATGQPVTPPLAHTGTVLSASYSPDGRRLVTACYDGTARIWELPTDDRPTEDLVKLSHLYACGKIDTGGGFVSLTAEETKKLFTELKAKYPADFTVTPAQAMAWHREQLADAERDKDWFAVAFHLRVLLREYAFADVELMTRLRDAEAKLKPISPR